MTCAEHNGVDGIAYGREGPVLKQAVVLSVTCLAQQ